MVHGKGFGSYSDKNQEIKIFPRFIYVEENANLDFVQLIKRTIDSFSFFELPKGQQNLLKKIRKKGYGDTFRKLLKGRGTLKGNQAFAEHSFFLGDFILNKISKEELKKHIPHNDVQFVFSESGNKIIVYFQNLRVKESKKYGEIYHSPLEPKIEIDGNQYIVAFTKHTIERICERVVLEWDMYRGLGDAFAYLYKCTFFEVCKLRDGQLALTFWDICGEPPFWHSSYIYKVLGVENFDRRNGDAYFRVGYCPILIEGNFAIAKTLLYPGYKKTPEYGCLMSSSLAESQKAEMLVKATKQDVASLRETNDFSCVQWFHNNGVPQVIQTREEIFAHVETMMPIMDLFRS